MLSLVGFHSDEWKGVIRYSSYVCGASYYLKSPMALQLSSEKQKEKDTNCSCLFFFFMACLVCVEQNERRRSAIRYKQASKMKCDAAHFLLLDRHSLQPLHI